jgi:sulfite oxidase
MRLPFAAVAAASGLFFGGAVTLGRDRTSPLGRAPWPSPVAAAPAKVQAGHFIPGLPEFTEDDIARRNGSALPRPGKKQPAGAAAAADGADRVWVTFRGGVYDVTDFLGEHPGGSKRLLLAAGTSIDPFWRQFRIHLNDEPMRILETLRVGNLKGFDAAAQRDDAPEVDLWEHEPRRHPALVAHSQQPFNAETPRAALLNELDDSVIVDNDLWFVRNHMPVPHFDADELRDFCLEVAGEGVREGCFTPDALRRAFPFTTVTTSIQCGGNRRSEAARVKAVKGLSWSGGAFSTAQWGGVPLRDVLRQQMGADADVKLAAMEADDDYHVHFHGADGDAVSGFSVSIPLSMAMDPRREVMIASEMNGDALPRDHGFPLRAIVPGVVGVRNCKWLQRIEIRRGESDAQWQQQDYKNFPNWLKSQAPGYGSVYDMPVQSSIVSAERTADSATVTGYTYCGGGRDVQRVEVSTDGGKTFTQAATLSDGGVKQARGKRWAARPFQCDVALPPRTSADDEATVCVRAISGTNDIQPAVAPHSFRGLLYNGYSCAAV